MHNADAISIMNCAFDNPCCFTYGGSDYFIKVHNFNVSFIGCVYKHVLFFKLLFLSSRPPQTIGNFLEISIAGRKCLCVTGKVVLWSKHFDIIILVPMFYLKCCIHTYIYIYIYTYIYIYNKIELGNNNNKYDRAPGATGRSKKVVPAISVDTLRGGRKKRRSTLML